MLLGEYWFLYKVRQFVRHLYETAIYVDYPAKHETLIMNKSPYNSNLMVYLLLCTFWNLPPAKHELFIWYLSVIWWNWDLPFMIYLWLVLHLFSCQRVWLGRLHRVLLCHIWDRLSIILLIVVVMAYEEIVNVVGNYLWGLAITRLLDTFGFSFSAVLAVWGGGQYLVILVAFSDCCEFRQCYYFSIVAICLESHNWLEFLFYLFIPNDYIKCACHLWAYFWGSVCKVATSHVELSGMCGIVIMFTDCCHFGCWRDLINVFSGSLHLFHLDNLCRFSFGSYLISLLSRGIRGLV